MNLERKNTETKISNFEKFATISAFIAGLSAFSSLVYEKKAASDFTSLERIEPDTIKLENGLTVTLQSYDGFEDVKIYNQPNTQPKKLIVLFGQTHQLASSQIKSFSEADRWTLLNQTVSSQKSIYSAIKSLKSQKVLNKVCIESAVSHEGIEQEVEGLTNFLPTATSSIVSRYLPNTDISVATSERDSIYSNGVTDDESTKLNEIENLERKYTEEYKYIVGGAQLLGVENTVRLCPAEDSKTNDAAFVAISNFYKSVQINGEVTQSEIDIVNSAMFEDREDIAIENISKEPESVIGLTYGNKHDFLDALSRWNVKHPTNTFALAIYSGKESEIFIGQDKLESSGFSIDEIKTISFAMKYKPWSKEKITINQQADGLAWLMENGNMYNFPEEKIVVLSEILHFGE